jgi:hypothetical protein
MDLSVDGKKTYNAIDVLGVHVFRLDDTTGLMIQTDSPRKVMQSLASSTAFPI